MASIRMDMLDAMYARVADMTIANGFNYDWGGVLRSGGNGSLAGVENFPVFNIKYMPESASSEAGQSLYFLEAPVVIKGATKYDNSVELSEQDYEVQESKSLMIEDLRKAFGYVSSAMCSAGMLDIVYTEEVETDSISGHIVFVELQFVIKWRDVRSNA